MKDGLTGDDADAVIGTAETDEDHAVEQDRQALEADISPEFRPVVARQLASVQAAQRLRAQPPVAFLRARALRALRSPTPIRRRCIASINAVRPQVQFDGCADVAHRVSSRWRGKETRGVIESRAAVLHRPGQPLTIETISVEPPRRGEVLVEIVASGLCHTDTTTFDGGNPSCVYPAVLGHEGAGRVVEVGDGVLDLTVGDHVIPLYGPECGSCAMCRSNRTNLCWTIKRTRDQGVMPDGSSRFRLGDQPVHHFMGTSTFSRYTVVPEIALARIRKDAPLDSVCLLGCAVTTGVGAALTHVQPGDSVVVLGLGGIGVNVVQGARVAGADEDHRRRSRGCQASARRAIGHDRLR